MQQQEYFGKVDFSKIAKSEEVRLAFAHLADQIPEIKKRQILADYANQDFITQCRIKRENSKNVYNKKSVFRPAYEFPSQATYDFLQAIFMPYYGKRWLFHPKVRSNQWVKVWRVTA
jgi:hypothetical protein